MSTYTESTCKTKCPFCKIHDGSTGFQKILDLKKSGLVLYRHTNRMDEINQFTGLLKSSIVSTDEVFIIQNTKDNKINAVDCVSQTVENISCPRCRELVQRAQKYLKNIPPIDKKDIISVCDHCKAKQRTQTYCNECRKVVKKFFVQQDKHSVAKEKIKAWLAKIQLFLKNVSTEKSKSISQCRAYSEFYLNNLCQDDLREITHGLDVAPMFKTTARISNMVASIDNKTSKSESALILLDTGIKKKSKNVSTSTESSHRMDRLPSSSISTYNTSINKGTPTNEEKVDSSDFFKKVLEKVNKLEHKNIKRQSSHAIKKYYSDEDIFFSNGDLADGELRKIFSYIFPKTVNKEIKHLRRVKTSAELIIDTQEMLRQRALEKSFQQVPLRKAISSVKEKKPVSIKSKEQDYKKDLEKEKAIIRAKTPSIINDKINASDKEQKSKINKENKSSTDKSLKDKKIQQKETQLQSKEKTEPTRKDKEEKLRLGEEKQKEKKIQQKETQIQSKEKTDQTRKDKEEKLRLIEEKQKEKPEQLKKEKDEKQKLKHEQQKTKDDKLKNFDENEKNKEKQQKEEVNFTIANLKKSMDEQAKQKNYPIRQHLDEDTKRDKIEFDKLKEETEKRSKKIVERNTEKKTDQDRSKTQEKSNTKELNITQVKMRRPSTDDLILQLVKLKQSNKKNETGKPLRLRDINVTPLMINEHKVHKGRKLLNCAICVDSDLELDVENIVNKKNKPEKLADIIVGNTILKSKLPLTENDEKEEMVPILFKSVFNDDAPVHQNEIAEMTTGKVDRKTLPSLSHKNVSDK